MQSIPSLYFFQLRQRRDQLRSPALSPVKSDDHSGVEPLLPISNRTVKRASADDSRVRPGESRSSSDSSSGKARFGGPSCGKRGGETRANGPAILILLYPVQALSHSNDQSVQSFIRQQDV